MLWVLDVLKIMIVLPYILVLLPGTSFKDSNEHIPGDVYLGATGHLVLDDQSYRTYNTNIR